VGGVGSSFSPRVASSPTPSRPGRPPMTPLTWSAPDGTTMTQGADDTAFVSSRPAGMAVQSLGHRGRAHRVLLPRCSLRVRHGPVNLPCLVVACARAPGPCRSHRMPQEKQAAVAVIRNEDPCGMGSPPSESSVDVEVLAHSHAAAVSCCRCCCCCCCCCLLR
jgi:hypothetical protein